MNILIKKPLFWIATAVFLFVGVGAILYLMPPLLQTFQDHRSKMATLDDQISAKQSYLDQINTLKKSSDTLKTLYASASQSLPTNPGNDLLSLQLEGLSKSLGLNLSITVPFNATPTTVSQPTVTTGGSDTVAPGGSANSGGGSSATVSTSGSQSTFTLTGTGNFTSLKALLVGLRGFGRWNKVSSIDLTQGSDTMTMTVTSQVFWKNSKVSDFAADTTLMTKASAVFGALNTYVTAPNAATEGSYGRGDPFAKP